MGKTLNEQQPDLGLSTELLSKALRKTLNLQRNKTECISGYCLKRCSCVQGKLRELIQDSENGGIIPYWMTRRWTILEDTNKGNTASIYRTITCLQLL